MLTAYELEDSGSISIFYVEFEVMAAVTAKSTVFWGVRKCNSYRFRLFGGTYCLHLQGRSANEGEKLQAELNFPSAS
jgi:hypothetical protein